MVGGTATMQNQKKAFLFCIVFGLHYLCDLKHKIIDTIMVKRLFTLAVLLASVLAASAAVRGDVNGDGVVDIDDLNAVINVMVHKNTDAGIEARTDIDGNGMVDIDDLNVVINVMVGKDNGGDTPETKTFTVGGVSFKMVAVAGGTFTMGATAEQGTNDPYFDEYPTHQVTLSSYAIGETEVTQELWQAVMGSNPSYFNGTGNADVGSSHTPDYGTNLQRPVDYVSWDECQTFITKLNQLTGASFRLPTEAEWEYAARGGNKSQGYIYAGANSVADVGWYYGNNPSKNPNQPNYGTQTVATKAPNELGLYDMSGNVCEWCHDWYQADYYSASPAVNPAGPESGTYRVGRGGDCLRVEKGCRVSHRDYFLPAYGNKLVGLRLAQ